MQITSSEGSSISDSEGITHDLQRKISEISEQENIPAISAGVIYQGAIASASSGALDRESGTLVGDDSIYQTASLSKTLTGIIIQSLIVDGRLDPKGPIATYLSPLLTADARKRLGSITLVQLMQHRSGITDKDCTVYRNRAEGEVVQSGYTRTELVADLNAIDMSGRTPDTFEYTSCGYAVAGLVGEIVTGQDFDALLRQYVTEPYDMPDTVVTLNDAQKSRLVTAYNKRNRSEAVLPYIMGKASPGSAIYSTVHDLQNLQAAQMKAYREFKTGRTAGPLILTKDVTTASLRQGFGQAAFGSGLIILPHPEGPFYLHDGDLDGFASVYVFSPKHNAGVVILTGSGGQWVTESAIEMLVDLIEEHR
ncbi:hypothetical protein A9995_14630 [Erythrobacter sp. QSSC1-22B]|nr:hypothetical protein A9995_14630 [Erythrobacter sp. QSSC1-22B]